MLTILSFVVVMGIIVFVHELGHFISAKRSGIVVEEFGFGFPPRVLKLGERDGTIYSLNAIPLGGFVRMRGEDDPTLAGSFAAAPRKARILTLLAGVLMNFALAIILFSARTAITGVPDTSRPGAVVDFVSSGSPAEQAGLLNGDRFVSADGNSIESTLALQQYTAQHLGKAITYEIIREGDGSGKQLQLTMTPRVSPPAGQGALGIRIGDAVRPANILESVWGGVRTTGEVIWLTFALPAMLLSQGQSLGEMGIMGPVGIAATTGDVVESALRANTLVPIIWFIGLLSVAIGITNLLPIPGLDGGRLVFVIVEALRRGKRVEPAQEGIIHLLGIGMLLFIVGLITIREVASLVNGTFPSVGLP
jgi:regulator of sigma E protease